MLIEPTDESVQGCQRKREGQQMKRICLTGLIVLIGLIDAAPSQARVTVGGNAGKTGRIEKSSSESDDDIPGVPIPKSPVKGSLDEDEDQNDIYRIQLKDRQRLTVTLNGDPGTDFDLDLYSPETKTIYGEQNDGD